MNKWEIKKTLIKFLNGEEDIIANLTDSNTNRIIITSDGKRYKLDLEEILPRDGRNKVNIVKNLCNFCEKPFEESEDIIVCDCGEQWCSIVCAENDGYSFSRESEEKAFCNNCK